MSNSLQFQLNDLFAHFLMVRFVYFFFCIFIHKSFFFFVWVLHVIAIEHFFLFFFVSRPFTRASKYIVE